MIDRTYRVSDVVNEEFIRFPLTLLANPKYRELSLEAKFVYALLLNRMTLSQKNNWINEENEVYLIYTREDAAETLNITYRKAIAAFKELIAVGLLHEQRQGRGFPNLLYVLKAELTEEDAIAFSDDFDGNAGENAQNEPETPDEMQICHFRSSRHAEIAVLDMQNPQFLNCKNGTSRPAGNAVLDMPIPHPRKIDNIKIESSDIENSQSIRPGAGKTECRTDGRTDDDAQQLAEILERCELYLFTEGVRQMFVAAIERLYYTQTLKIGDARLPQEKVRSYLHLLTSSVLMTVLESMQKNEERIVNPTAYLMSTIINSVCEQESDLILSLPPGCQGPADFYEGWGRGGAAKGGGTCCS